MKKQRIVQIDFDGVIHKYSKGWQGGEIYDEPVEGSKEALKLLTDNGYKVVIFCARLNETEVEDVELERKKMTQWLDKYGIKQGTHYDFMTCKKMGVVAYIDDRCIRFENNWSSIVKYFI